MLMPHALAAAAAAAAVVVDFSINKKISFYFKL